jgi:glyoxylase-like metal-dependent hydrolase (beta-lactamase superfamily II)
MSYEITGIYGKIANCYLVKTGTGFILIDTGMSFGRGTLVKTLEKAGCKPGNLNLVVITHADFDHTGNCAYLRKKYGTKIGIHRNESPAVETGRMLLNRKRKQSFFNRTMMYLMGFLIFRRFKPDIYLEDGESLSAYGLDARVYHFPGHSQGSIGVLTEEGDLFCGDLLVNGNGPETSSFYDDTEQLKQSVARLKTLKIRTVYPGHGRPFPPEEFFKNNP